MTTASENKKLISVLIRSVGVKEALKDALQSLLSQSYKYFEVVIIEDGKETLSGFLKEFNELNINYIALGKNMGRCIAGNKAMGSAKGEYFIFLDEDDMFYPNHLETLISSINSSNTKVTFSYSEELGVERDSSGKISNKGKVTRRYKQKFSLPLLLVCNYIPINTVLFHRSLFEQYGGFDEEVDYLEDWLLWVKYACNNEFFSCTGKYTTLYHVPLRKNVYKNRRKKLRESKNLIKNKISKLDCSLDIDSLRKDVNGIKGFYILFRRILNLISLNIHRFFA